jgi:hypothetical protein
MGFWNTFVKVWQVRTSIRIQENLENAVSDAREEKNLNENLPTILNEVLSKNELWDRELEHQRNINKK